MNIEKFLKRPLDRQCVVGTAGRADGQYITQSKVLCTRRGLLLIICTPTAHTKNGPRFDIFPCCVPQVLLDGTWKQSVKGKMTMREPGIYLFISTIRPPRRVDDIMAVGVLIRLWHPLFLSFLILSAYTKIRGVVLYSKPRRIQSDGAN